MGALGQLRIQTVFDLATSDVFANALQVVTVADPSTVEAALALLPGDAVATLVLKPRLLTFHPCLRINSMASDRR